MTSAWQLIWQRKGNSCQNHSLEQLIAADGFDLGAGNFDAGSWVSHVSDLANRLEVGNGDKVLEVGCGAGAFLFPLRGRGARLHGIDYAQSMVDAAQRAIPEGSFQCAEAAKLPFLTASFDRIFSHSVVNYFPDHAYTERVIREMARVLAPGGSAAILDINDAAKQAAFVAMRRGFLGTAEYERRYRECPQLFYSKGWLESVAGNLGMTCELFDLEVRGYTNSLYRFNALLRHHSSLKKETPP